MRKMPGGDGMVAACWGDGARGRTARLRMGNTFFIYISNTFAYVYYDLRIPTACTDTTEICLIQLENFKDLH